MAKRRQLGHTGLVTAGTAALVLFGAGPALAATISVSGTAPSAISTAPSAISTAPSAASVSSTVDSLTGGLLSPSPTPSPTVSASPSGPLPSPSGLVSSAEGAVAKITSSPVPSTKQSSPSANKGTSGAGRLATDVHLPFSRPRQGGTAQPSRQLSAPTTSGNATYAAGSQPAPQLDFGNFTAAGLPPAAVAPQLAPAATNPQLAPATAPQRVRLAAGTTPTPGLPMMLVVIAIAMVGAVVAAHLGVIQQRITAAGTHSA